MKEKPGIKINTSITTKDHRKGNKKRKFSRADFESPKYPCKYRQKTNQIVK